MSENKLPLVSVPVVTYNSSKYVIETLESIKAQTYQNIELIVSDDCSTDNTVQLCKDWIEKNKSRFVRTVLIESPVNTGVSANGNRAAAACQGEWVKGIAGDDLLMPECIETYIQFVRENPSASFVFTRVRAFGADERYNNYYVNTFFDYSFFDKSRKEQLHSLLFHQNCIPAPTFFYRRQAMLDLGVKNDERIPMLEDWPKWINLLSKGAKFDFFDSEEVLYRLRESSLSTSNQVSPIKLKSSAQLFILYQAKAQFGKMSFSFWWNKYCCARSILKPGFNFFSRYWYYYQYIRCHILRKEMIIYF